MAIIEDDFKEVYEFSKNKHSGQFRKSGRPYITHPLGVAQIVKVYGGSEDEIISSLLHDTMEDSDTSWNEIAADFGENVADIVSELTNDDIALKSMGKEEYMNKKLVNLSLPALFCKLADNYWNSVENPKPGQKERIIKNIKFLLRNRMLRGRWRELALAIINNK